MSVFVLKYIDKKNITHSFSVTAMSESEAKKLLRDRHGSSIKVVLNCIQV